MGSPTPTVAPNLLALALPIYVALPLHRLQAALTEDDGAYISPISPLHLPCISLYLHTRRLQAALTEDDGDYVGPAGYGGP